MWRCVTLVATKDIPDSVVGNRHLKQHMVHTLTEPCKYDFSGAQTPTVMTCWLSGIESVFYLQGLEDKALSTKAEPMHKNIRNQGERHSQGDCVSSFGLYLRWDRKGGKQSLLKLTKEADRR